MKITTLVKASAAFALLGAGAFQFAAAQIASAAAPPLRLSVTTEEAIGPFPSWGNAKTYGATGDGVTDDTAALQKALDDMNLIVSNIYGWKQEKPGSPAVLFLPAGTYRITKTLRQTNKYGVSIVGLDASKTRIVWDGAVGGTMLIADGVFAGKYARLTWDGKGKAGIGVAHWWNRKTTQSGNNAEHVDEVFTDIGVGIVAGCCGASSTPASHPGTDWIAADYGNLDSEGSVKRTKFIRNSVAGVSVESYNALDWWVMDSQFVDCFRGVTNALGAGNVHTYRNLFQRTKFADVHVSTPAWHSMHGNVSIGSRRFLEANMAGNNGGAMILKGNRILTTVNPSPIFLGNLGPLVMIDNQFLSTGTTVGPVVAKGNYSPGRVDMITVGNRFTTARHFAADNTTDRPVHIGNTTVAASTISTALPVMAATPVNQNRQVFEVPLTINAQTLVNETSAATIQAVINRAAASLDPHPIVHFPRGSFSLNATLVVPARRRIQLTGDGLATMLKAGPLLGKNPLIRLSGPSLATVREMRFYSTDYSVTAIAIDQADQPGGRILLNGTSSGVLHATDLPQTRIEAQHNQGIKGITASNAGSILSMGAGNIGPVFINNNSRLMMADTWFEGNKSDPLVRGNSGTFTYLGGRIAPPDVNMAGQVAGATIVLDNFAGQFTVLGLSYEMKRPDQGILVDRETAGTKALFLGITGNPVEFYYKRQNSGGQVGFGLMKTSRTTQVGNYGATDQANILAGLAQTRSLSYDTAPAVIPAGATDVYLYRIRTVESAIAYQINGK